MRPGREKILKYVRDLKTSTPCMDCAKHYVYYAMQFDHVRGVKIDKINRMVYTSSFAMILAEIAKCDIVCANCHHIRTYLRSPHNEDTGLRTGAQFG